MTGLRIDADAAELRRLLGPVPWFVLEELLLGHGTEHGDAIIAHASARSLAESASLNKDTVARSLAALGRAGIVTAQQQANDSGRFGSGGYRIDSVAGVQRIPDTATTSAKPSSKATPLDRSHPQPTHEPMQLALLDVIIASAIQDADRRPARPLKRDDALAPGVRGRPVGVPRDGRDGGGTEAGRC